LQVARECSQSHEVRIRRKPGKVGSKLKMIYVYLPVSKSGKGNDQDGKSSDELLVTEIKYKLPNSLAPYVVARLREFRRTPLTKQFIDRILVPWDVRGSYCLICGKLQPSSLGITRPTINL